MPRGTRKRNFKKKKTRNKRRLKKSNNTRKRKQRRTRRKSKKGGAPCDGEQGISITGGCKPGRYSIINIKDDGIYLVLGMTNNPIRGIKRKHQVIKWDENSEKFNFPYLYKNLIRFKLDRYKNWEYIYTMDNSNKKSLILEVDTYVTDFECADFFSNAYNTSTDNNKFIQNIESEINKRKKKKEDAETKRIEAVQNALKKYRQSVQKSHEAAIDKERAAAAAEATRYANMSPKEQRIYKIQQDREKRNNDYDDHLLNTTSNDHIISDYDEWVWNPEN